MSDDMETLTRISHAEWEIRALKEKQQRQEERISEMTAHMDARFDQVLSALHELRDNRSREEGAAEAREYDAVKRQRFIKWVSLGAALLMLMLAFGWLRSADATWLPISAIADAPIPVQYYTREVP